MSAVQQLRAATAADHDRVDAAYGGFDLLDHGQYGRFLLAHARALPAVEGALAARTDLPPLRPRTPALLADIATFGLTIPAPLPFASLETEAAAFGAAYVVEGSRLGGGMLARQVPAGFPRAYLSSVHRSGEWRAFLTRLDAAAGDDADWIARSVATAKATFALYALAALESDTAGA